MPDAGLYRRATATAFIVAPLLLLADNILHPKEYAPGNEAEQLRAAADAYERWQIAHTIGLLAILVLAVAMAGLAFLVMRRSRRIGLAGGLLTIAGIIGFGSVLALDGFTWGVLGHVSGEPATDQATVEQALDEIQNSGWGAPYYLLAGAWIAGLVLLAVAAWRSRALPLLAAVLLAVAAVVNGLETVFPSNAYFIAGAAILLTAGLSTAWALWQMSDDEFAAGGPPAAEP